MIQGDVFTFLNALEAEEADPRVERALAMVGGEPTVETYDDEGVEEKYLNLSEQGASFLFMDGTLDTVFVYAAASSTRNAYARWSTLIEGIGPDSSREDIERVLGAPLRSTGSYMTYEADPGFVQFDFDGASLKSVVIMSELVGGQSPAVEQPEASGATSVEGDIAVFMRAIGKPMFSPEHFAVIGLTGPATDSSDEERDGAAWQYENSGRTGVVLQFKQEIMVGALIPLASSDGDPVYPSPDQLIDGLVLPAAREAVSAHFGTPRQSIQGTDLYLVDDTYLRFDFETGQSSAVTVVQRGAEV